MNELIKNILTNMPNIVNRYSNIIHNIQSALQIQFYKYLQHKKLSDIFITTTVIMISYFHKI